MNHIQKLVFIILVGALLVPGLAYATNYSVVFCFEYDVDYEDRSGGDWWNSTADKTARGVLAYVSRNSDSAVMYYDFTNSSTGCTPALTLSSNRTYSVRTYSHAKLTNNNEVHVKNNDDDELYFYVTLDTSYSPTANATETYTWTLNTNNWVSNICAATGYSINKRYGGLSSEDFIVFNEECPGNGGSCSTSNGVYISTFGREYKFIISHEMGHYVGRVRDEDSGPVCNYGANATICDEWSVDSAHDYVSKEYQTAGAVEGFAHFYAATVWNDITESNCQFYYYKLIDWDKDGTAEPRGNRDCETGGDYLTDECTGTLARRGVEVDWLRFWWDLLTDEGETFGNIVDIYDRANPKDWSASNVYSRLRTAADDEGVDLTEWDDWAEWNGVDR